MLTLANARCRVTFAAHGAELTGLQHPETGLEYLWQADPAVWARHAPVLFPIVGRLPHDTYLHRGQPYQLGQHGFARDREFTVLQHTATEVVFQLRDDEASRRVFPFAFELTIAYTLREAVLTVAWTVHNPSPGAELLFSIGAHPAFRCPRQPGEDFSDYYFEFDHPVRLHRHLLAGGLLTGATTPVPTEQAALPLSYDLFADDALVFKHYDFTRLTLRSRRSPEFVRLAFDGFPYLGLWTKGPGAEFVCVEPWQGIASSVGEPGELRDKEGILTLGPGQTFAAAYTIEIG
jgi:galactose mutarotase-like enzyme